MLIKTGDKAPCFTVKDTHNNSHSIPGEWDGPTLLTLYRHAGCPPCNLRVREIMLAKTELDKYGVRIIAVFESPATSIERDLAHNNVPFPILPDEKRILYNLFDVKPSVTGFLKSLFIKPMPSIKAIFKYGYLPVFSEATAMMPADFLLDADGTVLLCKYGKDFGDYLQLNDIFSTLKEKREL